MSATPEREKEANPVFFIPGWSETPESYEQLLEELAKKGRKSFALNYNKFPVTELVGSSEIVKSEALYEVLKQKEIPKADLIAHSEGGVVALIAAATNPENFDKIILINPAGLLKDDSHLKLISRFVQHTLEATASLITKPETRKKQLQTLFDINTYPLKRPERALVEEPATMAQDFSYLLEPLREAGLKIVLINNEQDKVFPQAEVKDNAADKVDYYLTAVGEHNQLLLEPEKYATFLDSSLNTLDQLKDSPEEK